MGRVPYLWDGYTSECFGHFLAMSDVQAIEACQDCAAAKSKARHIQPHKWAASTHSLGGTIMQAIRLGCTRHLVPVCAISSHLACALLQHASGDEQKSLEASVCLRPARSKASETCS